MLPMHISHLFISVGRGRWFIKAVQNGQWMNEAGYYRIDHRQQPIMQYIANPGSRKMENRPDFSMNL